MTDVKVLTRVPDSLKRLVRLTARAFYQPLQIVCLDILTKYPCVTEVDLVEVLKMQGSQKQLRQSLNILKKDKLVTWLQKMENQGEKGNSTTERPNKMVVHYYYINYKQFVNIVKYKLSQMRIKLESDNRMTQNRTSYICTCNKTFSDLDVGELFDHKEGTLRCSYCNNILKEEEKPQDAVDSRMLISQLNEYVKPITDLLRETESLNLAPELLEPEVQSIQKYLQTKGMGRRTSASGRDQTNWASRSVTDLYGDSTAISVNIGNGSQLTSKAVAKEAPEWLTKSTVHPASDAPLVRSDETTVASAEPTYPKYQHEGDVSNTDRQILEDLMTHEIKQPKTAPLVGMPGYLQEQDVVAQYSSSSSSGEEDMETGAVGGASWIGTGGGGFDDIEEFDEESSEEEGYTVRVGDRVVPVNEVTSQMVAQMTREEKDRYTAVCQKAYSQDYI